MGSKKEDFTHLMSDFLAWRQHSMILSISDQTNSIRISLINLKYNELFKIEIVAIRKSRQLNASQSAITR